MVRWSSRLLLLLVVVGVVACDHATKQIATRHLGEAQAIELVPRVLDLRRVANSDTAFGLLGKVLEPTQRRALILSLQGVAIAVILSVIVRRRREARTVERVAGALVLGGAVGNFADRLFRGYVIDFIHLSYWPVFNVADIALCLGIGLSLLAVRLQPVRAVGP